MGRVPCCEKDNVRRGQWTPEEDNKLSSYIAQHGTRNWRLIPKNAGLQRCGKSCRLRWTNYLRPDLKHGDFSHAEEQVILKLHSVVGNRWSLIAAQLPGRTDNDVKNYWNTKLKKKLSRMGIDPVTHKPFSHLMAEISSLAPPQVAHLAEAALGCFKDEMLHLLTKTRIDFNHHHYNSNKQLQLIQQQEHNNNIIITNKDSAAEDNNNNNKTKLMSTLPLSRVMTMQEQELLHRSSWDAGGGGFQYVPASPWSQSMCSGSTCTAAAAPAQLLQHDEKIDDHQLEENEDDHQLHVGKGTSPSARNSIFAAATDSLLWDIPSDDLINPVL